MIFTIQTMIFPFPVKMNRDTFAEKKHGNDKNNMGY